MSSWLSSFSLPNPFKSESDDEDAAGDDQDSRNDDETSSTEHHSSNSTSSITSRVKQDLSALSHHLLGVAAFLAPPAPPQPPTDETSSSRTSSPAPLSNEAFTGIKRDLEEIGGSFKSLFSSSSTGISKFASSLLQSQEDGDVIHYGGDGNDGREEGEEEESYEDIPGINEEVVDFVRKVSLRPELWTDFPLSLPTDFDMSDNQIEHAAGMEELVPSLLTLRQQTCSNFSDGQFWMIYFVILLPRLNETDVELLSTSEIIEVRETLLKKLQSKNDVKDENSGIPETGNVSAAADEEINATPGHGSLSEQKDLSAESSSIARVSEVEIQREKLEGVLEHEDAGQDESLKGQKYTEDADDVSFSDLEDDGNDLSDRVSGRRRTQSGRGSSASESSEWVRLNENSGVQGGQNKPGLLLSRRGKDSEGDESSDWLTVDDFDTDTLAGAV